MNMKNKLLLILLLPYLTNCSTLAGFTIDTIRNNKEEHKITDIINQENQSITFQTIHNASMKARYQGLIYKPERINHSGQSLINSETKDEIITLPQIGDSLTVLSENQTKSIGLFWGFEKHKTGYHLIVFHPDLDKTDYINFSSIEKISWSENLYEIQDPNIDRFFMKYEGDDLRNEIAFSEIKHLNTTRPKLKFTKIGLIVDGILGTVAVVGCLQTDCFDYSFYDQ